jgi:hypothetical protein
MKSLVRADNAASPPGLHVVKDTFACWSAVGFGRCAQDSYAGLNVVNFDQTGAD